MKKILAIVQHRKGRSPGQRFRFEHFIPYLEANGYEIVFSNYLNENDDKTFYASGRYFSKFIIAIKCFFHRYHDLKLARQSDLIFIYREAYMLGTVFFEKRFSKMNAPMIFDFDDSIWLNDTSDGNKKLAWIKKPEKTSLICKYSDLVIVGNQYLASYASQFNNNVAILPTTIDTNYHKPPVKHKSDKRICIGWTGTSTTLKHYYTAIPVLKEIKALFGEKVYFKVIANTNEWEQDLDVVLTQWSKENEIAELSEFDIGIMPLPDDLWSKGKCGFKGLQCMAMEIPVIMSPVGVNTEIIQHGENGFLAATPEEWLSCIVALINDANLRNQMGKAGRKSVLEKYSVDSLKSKYLNLFDSLLNK